MHKNRTIQDVNLSPRQKHVNGKYMTNLEPYNADDKRPLFFILGDTGCSWNLGLDITLEKNPLSKKKKTLDGNNRLYPGKPKNKLKF